MSQPALLQDKFKGFQQDAGKEHVPSGYVWDMVDFVPRLGSSLVRRGGWEYAGPALDSLNGSATAPMRVMWASFASTAGQLLAWDTARLYDLTNGADRGATTVPLNTPVLFRDLVIWGDGNASAKKYDGAAVGTLGGSPPTTPRVAEVHKERLVFSGRSTVIAEYSSVYFSAAGNPESWDTTNSVIQTNAPIFGLASVRDALIVFHQSGVEIVRGATPPSATGVGDMSLSPLYDNVGLFDPNSYAKNNESVIWADENGLYSTDGAALTDLTEKGGIKQYWQSMIDDQNQTGDPVTKIAVGAWRGHAVVSVQTASAFVDFLVCHLESRSWFRFSNIQANNFAPRPNTDAMYFSNRATKYVGNLAPTFLPGGTDDDATGSMSPKLFSPYYLFDSKGGKRIRHVYLTAFIQDSNSNDPQLTMAYNLVPESETYTALSPVLGATGVMARNRFAVNQRGNGVAFRLSMSGGASGTRIYALETDSHPIEGSRRFTNVPPGA